MTKINGAGKLIFLVTAYQIFIKFGHNYRARESGPAGPAVAGPILSQTSRCRLASYIFRL